MAIGSRDVCFFCGPDYYEYAAVFAELGIVRANPIKHSRARIISCNLCTPNQDREIWAQIFCV